MEEAVAAMPSPADRATSPPGMRGATRRSRDGCNEPAADELGRALPRCFPHRVRDEAGRAEATW